MWLVPDPSPSSHKDLACDTHPEGGPTVLVQSSSTHGPVWQSCLPLSLCFTTAQAHPLRLLLSPSTHTLKTIAGRDAAGLSTIWLLSRTPTSRPHTEKTHQCRPSVLSRLRRKFLKLVPLFQVVYDVLGGKCTSVVQPVGEISSKTCRHWVSPALYLPNVTDMSKVHPAGKKTMRQNDLQKQLLVMGQPTKKGNVFMCKGVGQLHPFSCCIPRGVPFSDITFVRSSALVPEPYCPASCSCHLFIYKYNGKWILAEGNVARVWWLLHMSAAFWSGGSWAQACSQASLTRGLSRREWRLKWTSDFKRFKQHTDARHVLVHW